MAPSRKKKVVLAVAPLAFFATLVACNNIIGLTDFEKGECPGARCATNDGGPDQFVPDGGDEGSTDSSFDAKGAPPAVWAQWHMPNYGEGGPGEPQFPLDYGDAGTVVIDKVTGLNWQRSPIGENVSPSQADAKCETTYGPGWRAPKRIELVTLIDYGRAAPYIDRNRFDVSLDTLGTTSPVRNVDKSVVPDTYYVIDFGTGVVKPGPSGLRFRFLCLKGK